MDQVGGRRRGRDKPELTASHRDNDTKDKTVTRMIIIGPPGAGKGTQARFVAQHFGVPGISTGDIFRANVAQATPLGIEAKQFMDVGEYVPDDLTNKMVRDRLGQPDATEGFILDGYPRTEQQVKELDEMLARTGRSVDAVIYLSVDQEEIVARMLRRAGIEKRADDTEEVIRRRQDVYGAETEPLIDLYRRHGQLVEVPGLGGVAEVTDRILSAVIPHLAPDQHRT